MKKILASCLALLSPTLFWAQNQAPIITQLSLTPDWPNKTLHIAYQVDDAENDPLEISLQFSDNGGKTFSIGSTIPTTGDIGFPVQPGARNIVCDISALSGMAASFVTRLVADDRQPFDIQALVNEVDSNQLRNQLHFIEGIRHRTTGNNHLNAVRDSLKNLFLNTGLFYEEQAVPLGAYTGKNLLGTLPGVSASEKVVINDAHYDTVNNAPGADDNGSGVVGVMEGVRLLSRYPAKKSLRFIGFDLEESGLVGSIRYAAAGIPAGEQIEGVFNYEMIGYWSDQPNSQSLPSGFGLLFPLQSQMVADNQFRGDFITNVGNTYSQALALLYSNSAQEFVPGLKVITLDVPGNGQIVPDLRRSDHTPFWETNRQALMLTDGANFRNECYHTPGDTLTEKLNFTFMSNVVKATVASMAQLAETMHGDWASANFEGMVNTQSPSVACQLVFHQSTGQNDGFSLQMRDCECGNATLELYDMKGAMHLKTQANLSANAASPLQAPGLSAGVYVLKVRCENGTTQSQKILFR